MNLVAKEYIASRRDYGRMLIISETAGAASEALLKLYRVNPYDVPEIAEGIKRGTGNLRRRKGNQKQGTSQ